jgi:hypothetical protein
MDTQPYCDTRSKKQFRKDDSEDVTDLEVDANQVNLDDMEPVVRDAVYYKEDGDCVLLVGKVLFKARNIFFPCYRTDIN